MAYLPPRGTTLKLYNSNDFFAPGDDRFAVYETALYDPFENADLANHGVKVYQSGVYTAGLAFTATQGVAGSGEVQFFLNCAGAAGPDVFQFFKVPFNSTGQYAFTWLGYMHVATPDVASIEIVNNTDATFAFSAAEFSLAYLG